MENWKPPGSLFGYETALLAYLFLSLPLSAVTQWITNVATKQLMMALVGVIFMLAYTGYYSLLVFAQVIVSYSFMKYASSPTVAALLIFGYRFFAHSWSFLVPDFPWVHPQCTCADDMSLILTLKMITLVYDVDDFRKSKATNKVASNNSSEKHMWPLEYEPTLLQILCYIFSFQSSQIGPFIRFRTYYDMLHMPREITDRVPRFSMFIWKFLESVSFGILFIYLSPMFGNHVFESDDLYQETFFVRLNFSLVRAFLAICMFTFAWGMVECNCILCGCGVYPTSWKPIAGNGPTIAYSKTAYEDFIKSSEISFNSDTVNNMKVWKLLMAKTGREVFRYWNTGVQWWLVLYVYKAKILLGKPRALRAETVSFASALWHSSFGGHFMSFTFSVFAFYVEDVLLKTMKPRLRSKRANAVYDFFHWLLIRVYLVNYMMMPSLLKTYTLSIRYFASTYFVMHFFAVALFVFCTVINTVWPCRRKTE